jgi:dTMP kinase
MKNFITFEGGEGSGKTTIIKKVDALIREIECRDIYNRETCKEENEFLKAYLTDAKGAILTREPGGCQIAEQIRNVILHRDNITMNGVTEFFLFCAARQQHLVDTVIPALKDNKLVLCDRYYHSTYIYQCRTRKCVNERDFDDLNTKAISVDKVAYHPGLVLVFDVDTETGLSRSTKRNVDQNNQQVRLDNETLEFHKTVNKEYSQLRPNFYVKNLVHIDANKPLREVYLDVVKVITNYLSLAQK